MKKLVIGGITAAALVIGITAANSDGTATPTAAPTVTAPEPAAPAPAAPKPAAPAPKPAAPKPQPAAPEPVAPAPAPEPAAPEPAAPAPAPAPEPTWQDACATLTANLDPDADGSPAIDCYEDGSYVIDHGDRIETGTLPGTPAATD